MASKQQQQQRQYNYEYIPLTNLDSLDSSSDEDYSSYYTMSSLFRSELMSRCQLILQSEAAYNCIAELGEIGLVQFVDLNPDVSGFQRKFVSEVKRCEEMERKLRFVEKECVKDHVPIYEPVEEATAPPMKEIMDMDTSLSMIEQDLTNVNSNYVMLKKNRLELLELKHVLMKTESFFSASRQLQFSDEESEEEHRSLLQENDGDVVHSDRGMKFNSIVGMIDRERLNGFEKMLWRVSKGNVFVKTSDIDDDNLEDPVTGSTLLRSVFVVFFQGEQLKTRVQKICEGFHARQYACPSRNEERLEMAKGVNTQLQDLATVLKQTEEHRIRILVNAAENLRAWYTQVRKFKAIHHCLNLFNFDVTQKAMIGECWIPESELVRIQTALQKGADASGSTLRPILNSIDHSSDPPTFNRTNKFTYGFQAIIDAYGINSYREINPAAFSIITFPFLFGVMFGDFGHGLIMLAFSLWLVLQEKKLAKIDNEIFVMIYGGRYIILLMSLFSVYTGLIYNDCFSKPFNIFSSSWRYNGSFNDTLGLDTLGLDPADPNQNNGYTYVFGVDPAWQLASNKITFLNTYKMKISLIFGLLHMVFGVCVSLGNKIHFKHYSDIALEFVPQLIFLLFIFCYLVFLIFFKWMTYGAGHGMYSERCAPNLLITFINMILFKYKPNGDKKLEALCHGRETFMFTGQQTLQKGLVVIGVLMIPVMLLGKPIHIFMGRRRRRADYTTIGNSQDEDVHEEGFGDIMIFQGIHTIEYVLGAVSHTASYLRLWALSLAHSQLSEVLWNMVMRNGFTMSYTGAIWLYFIFSGWAVLTVAILVMMEGMSAFLHTMRLHWVEFMSKFYEGKGSSFEPFSFRTFLQESSLADREVMKE